MAIVEVDISNEDASLMVLSGFARRDTDGGLYLTDKGNLWIRDWISKRMDEHNAES